jgi:hypothetical protein
MLQPEVPRPARAGKAGDCGWFCAGHFRQAALMCYVRYERSNPRSAVATFELAVVIVTDVTVAGTASVAATLAELVSSVLGPLLAGHGGSAGCGDAEETPESSVALSRGAPAGAGGAPAGSLCPARARAC